MYSFSNKFSDSLNEILDNFPFKSSKKRISYCNVPFVFDIETTSFYEGDDKRAVMYAWVFGANGKCILGRTWKEFVNVIHELVVRYDLNANKRIVIWIHNLAFEFQFLRKYFDWQQVFSLDERDPIYALTVDGIEFRCSYHLSNYSLVKVGENLVKYKASKLIGNLNYDLPRHTKTVLTEKEKDYILYDGIVVMNYIQELIEQYGSITKLPLTSTGFVRNYTRNMCFYNGGNSRKMENKSQFFKYRRMMNRLTISGVDEYRQLVEGFQGGFTHANPFHVGLKLSNVKSYDFTSSYPYVMVSEHFPMSSGKEIKITSVSQLNHYLQNFCCLFTITLYDLEPIFHYDHYISKSKCRNFLDLECENGRVIKAKELTITITEQDYFIIKKTYKWSRVAISNFRRYYKGYLPKQLIMSILKLYSDKTQLKGVEGKEVEYMHSKPYINSCYGMMVTNICRDEIVYDNDNWSTEKPNYDELITKYNESQKRFLFYPWGVWVTAYARRNLWTGIYECGEDYIYSDTDSLKICNADKHEHYFIKYNRNVITKLKTMCTYYNIDFNLCKPKNIKGEEKMLGVWDFDGEYDFFKTQGAKRYMTQKKDKFSLTIAGLNKTHAMPYLIKNYEDPFSVFKEGMYIPSEYTGKLTHTYCDYHIKGKMLDYNGVVCDYEEASFIHLEKATFEMSITREFLDFIVGIKTKYKGL